MSKIWSVQEAEERFSEFLASSVAEGPQVVAKQGTPIAVLVPIEEWRRLQEPASLKDLLLAPGARTDALTPERKTYRLRPPLALE